MELPKTARASVFRQPNEPLEMKEYPIVLPRDGEVLIRVLRTNICGSDLHMISGEAFGSFPVPYPFTLGHETVGRVAALGEGVRKDSRGESLKVGDLATFSYYTGCRSCRVCAKGDEHACVMSLLSLLRKVEDPPHFVGGFAEYYMVRRKQALFKLPPEVEPLHAAGINCALAQVMYGLQVAKLEYGESVVIQGAGGLGLYATAVARDMGAGQVIVVDGVADRLALAKELGADETISLEEVSDKRQRTQKVKDLTGGGADIVVELTGHSEAIREGVRMLQRGGRYAVMGAINPKQPVKLDASMWIGQNLHLLGVSLYPVSILPMAMEFVRRNARRLPLGKMLQVFPFTDINSAVEAARNRTGACRVQLSMEEG